MRGNYGVSYKAKRFDFKDRRFFHYEATNENYDGEENMELDTVEKPDRRLLDSIPQRSTQFWTSANYSTNSALSSFPNSSSGPSSFSHQNNEIETITDPREIQIFEEENQIALEWLKEKDIYYEFIKLHSLNWR